MKAAKHTAVAGKHRTCGSCVSVVKIKDDPSNVVCVVHLQKMPVDYVADCEHHDTRGVPSGPSSSSAL
jgi:hypothetical protein